MSHPSTCTRGPSHVRTEGQLHGLLLIEWLGLLASRLLTNTDYNEELSFSGKFQIIFALLTL
jgi:hypothetical protein